MTDLGSTSFGYIIAFLLPGLLGLYALSLWFQGLKKFLDSILSPTTTIGPSSLVVLAALTIGVIVGALRFYVFQRWICGAYSLNKDIFKNLTGEKLTAFRAVADEHYRYHQFYGGCAVVLLGLFPRWLWLGWSEIGCLSRTVLIGAFLLLELVLALTAVDSFKQYVERGNMIAADVSTRD